MATARITKKKVATKKKIMKAISGRKAAVVYPKKDNEMLKPLFGLRLRPGEHIHTLYRALRRKNGEVRVLYRIVWNGDKEDWIFGDGFYAHEGTGWCWCPEDFKQLRGIAWRVSGMGGADDDTEPISKDAALAILATHGIKPDCVDNSKFPSIDMQKDWRRISVRVERQMYR